MNQDTKNIDRKERDIEVKNFIKKMKSKPKLNHEILSSNIVINGRWGDGKTTFLEQIKEQLTKTEDKEIKLDDIITISAWDYDFLDDPTEMILDILIKNKDQNKIIEKISDQIKNFLKGFSKEIINQNKFFKLFYEGSKKAIVDSKKNKEKDSTKSYLNFIDLKKRIQKNIEEKDGNVYIFIDDLDRCNTNFVIKLIEITKHLFNIENVVIIYMLDLKNINHSIVKYYNLLEDNDANETYLSKIIDYVHNLEEVDKTTYLLNRYELSWITKRTGRKTYQNIFNNLKNQTFRNQERVISILKNIEIIITNQKIEDPEDDVKVIIILSIIQYLCEENSDLMNKLLNNVVEQEISNNIIPREVRQFNRENLNKIISFFENVYKKEGIYSAFSHKDFSSTNLNTMSKIDFKKLFNVAINANS